MRSYEQMVESGDWPPTNRETILMFVGGVIGFIIGFTVALALVTLEGS